MKRKRHTPDEVISKLRDVDATLSSGGTIADAAKKIGVTETTLQAMIQKAGVARTRGEAVRRRTR